MITTLIIILSILSIVVFSVDLIPAIILFVSALVIGGVFFWYILYS